MPELLDQPATVGLGIQARNLRRTYPNGVTALERFSLDVSPGDFVSILGPSGCGKSTLLRMIAGLDAPQEGSVTLSRGAGEAGKPRRGDTAFVFQDAHLLPWRNVVQNVSLPLELMGVGRRARADASLRAIERVGLSDAAGRYPGQLSGGMRMRVSLARAMVTGPRLLLLDEPFAALDEITRQRLDEQLRAMWAAGGMTIVFVTHSTAEAVFLSRRAVVLSARPGRIVHDQPIDLPDARPASLRGTPEYARETRAVYEALEKGGR